MGTTESGSVGTTGGVVIPSLHPGIWLSQAWDQSKAADIAQRAGRLGYQRVVVPLHNLDAVDPAAVRSEFARAGVEAINSIGQVPTADVSSDDPEVRDRGVERLRQAATAAHAMGSRHLGGVVYGCLGSKRAVDANQVQRTARVLGELADEIAPLGVRLVCEVVNRYETPMLNTAAQAVSFIEEARSDNIGIHLDTFHMNIEETDLLAAVERALPRLWYLELSQNTRNGVADGLVNLADLLEKAVARGYRGLVGVESFSAAVSDEQTQERLSIWREVFPADNTIAEDAIALMRPWT